MSVLSELREDWQGIPVPVPGETVVLAPRHPLAEKFKAFQTSGDGERGTCGTELPRVVNHWFSYSRAREVFILEDPDGRRHAETFPVSPGFAMDRLELWIRTLGPSDAWDLEAEHRAQEKLRGLVSDRQWRHFELTGTFLETSPRSRLTYLLSARPAHAGPLASGHRRRRGPNDLHRGALPTSRGLLRGDMVGLHGALRRPYRPSPRDAGGRGRLLEAVEPPSPLAAGGRRLTMSVTLRGQDRRPAKERTVLEREGEVVAALRDASWYRRPSTTPGTDEFGRANRAHGAGRYHVATLTLVDGEEDPDAPISACGRSPLDLEGSERPAPEVESFMRCGRPGCRERWPAP